MAKVADAVSVGRAFGAPIEHGDVLVIPVAWVAGGGGGGGVDAGAEDAAPGNGRAQQGKSGESGGGFGGFTWPLGVYVVKNGDVRWVPALDATRIVLSAIVLVRTIVKLRAVRRVK